MRRIESRAPGGPETLVLSEAPAPQPKGDEVAVYLAIENHQTGSVREEIFRYRRKARVD